MHQDLKFEAKKEIKSVVQQRFADTNPEWSLPLSYDSMEMLTAKNETPAPENTHAPKPQATKAEKTAPPTKAQTPDYSGEEITAEQEQEFEIELQSFLDILEKHEGNEPRPEKW